MMISLGFSVLVMFEVPDVEGRLSVNVAISLCRFKNAICEAGTRFVPLCSERM